MTLFKQLTLAATVAATAALMLATSASAHVVLQDGVAAAGAGYRAAFLVGHGCDGSATTAIRVQIPEGFQGAKPMPKAGWTLKVSSAKLAKPYESYGKTVTDDVVEISWTANGRESFLQDAWYDEFVLRGTTPKQPGQLWFKVLQTCEKGQVDWAEIPAKGVDTHSLKSPAAMLEVIDMGGGEGHHH